MGYKQKVLEPEPNPKIEPLEGITPTTQRVEVNNSEALVQAVLQIAPGFNPKVFAVALARFGETRTRHAITERAGSRCEYCLLRSGLSFFPHDVDHIIAEKHGGATVEAWAQTVVEVLWLCIN